MEGRGMRKEHSARGPGTAAGRLEVRLQEGQSCAPPTRPPWAQPEQAPGALSPRAATPAPSLARSCQFPFLLLMQSAPSRLVG